MKKLLFLLLSVVLFTSCDEKQIPPCNCKVIGNDHLLEVIDDDGIQIVHSSLPMMIFPYDTVVNCDQNGVSWYKITETIAPAKTITKTSYRKIECN